MLWRKNENIICRNELGSGGEGKKQGCQIKKKTALIKLTIKQRSEGGQEANIVS